MRSFPHSFPLPSLPFSSPFERCLHYFRVGTIDAALSSLPVPSLPSPLRDTRSPRVGTVIPYPLFYLSSTSSSFYPSSISPLSPSTPPLSLFSPFYLHLLQAQQNNNNNSSEKRRKGQQMSSGRRRRRDFDAM